MENELVIIEKTNVLTAFSAENGLESVINQAKQAVEDFEHDMSTAAGRKRTASLAHKVARLKTSLDGMGKESVADLKAKTKAVDANRKAMRDQLDDLKSEARKPLTQWEEEQARIEAEKKAEEERKEVQMLHEMAILMNAEFDRAAEEAIRIAEEQERKLKEQEELERIAREEEGKRQAAEQAKLEAERKAAEDVTRIERERQKAEDEKARAEAVAKQAERDRIAAEERAKAQAELAENQRIEDEQRAKKERIAAEERARQDEINRQKAEQEKAKREQEQREANKRHVGSVRRAAKEAIMSYTDEETARKIVMAINNGEVPAVTISY